MSQSIICRLCRTPLLHEGGCDVCTTWKRNLALVGDAPVERIDLGELSGETLALMRGQLQRLQHAVRMADVKGALAMTKDIQDFARGMATFMSEARKLRKEGARAMRAMSFQEQRALFYSWVGSLPPAHRRNVADGLLTTLEELGQPAQLPAGEEDEDDVD
jgi:hypothetical protein